MSRYCLWILAALMGLVCASPAVATAAENEHAERAAIAANVHRMIEIDDYAGLDALAEKYRRYQTRTSSGTWKLTWFYGAISDAMSTRDQEDSLWEMRQVWVDGWIKQYPASPTARLAAARLQVNRAWSIRGSSGLAHTVEKHRWAPFKAQNLRAWEYLESIKSIARVDPYWYELAEVVAQRQGMDGADFIRLFDEGSKLHPEYLQLYFSAVNFYEPKWGGSAEHIEAVIRHAMKRVPRKERPALYARMYWVASQGTYGSTLFTNSMVRWPLMKRGFDNVLAEYPSEWNLQAFAYFACAARDKPKTRALIERMREPADKRAWDSVRLYERCHDWALGDAVADIP